MGVPVKLLVIEDDPVYLGLLENYLSGLVDELIFAETWEKASKHVDWANIVWLDAILPDANETQALVNIGEVRQRNSNVVIFVVSGVLSPLFPEQAVAAGADLFVPKEDAVLQTQVIALMLQAINRLPGIDVDRVNEKARHLLRQRITSKQ